MTDLVLVATAGRVTTLTLHRPEARNALNRAVREGLREAFTEFEEIVDLPPEKASRAKKAVEHA